MSDCLVIIPTYNEKENIELIIRKVFSLEKELDLLVVEDNSPDGTADLGQPKGVVVNHASICLSMKSQLSRKELHIMLMEMYFMI